MDWTEKYRPQKIADLVDNGPALGRMRQWAEAWKTGVPEVRALVLAGPPGCGKTSAALALGRDMGWSVIELNASDGRNADVIKRTATAGSLHQTFGADGTFRGGGASAPDGAGRGASKLIILDEADNLYERMGSESGGAGTELGDRGGKAQIIETIRNTRQPILLIVNDLYALEKGSGSALKSLAETLKFTRVNVRSIPALLEKICRLEGIQVERDVLESVAAKAEGDLRAAIRDLEVLCAGRTKVTRAELGALGTRDTTTSMFDLVRHILKGRSIEDIRKEVWSADATPEDLVLWIDENMPREYKDPEDLVRGYELLARADVFLGRTKRTQDYGLWGYASELATLGPMVARKNEYHQYVPFGFPTLLMKMSRTRGLRQTKDELALALGRHTHCSKRKARSDQVEMFAELFRNDPEFAVAQTHALELDDEAVALLLGEKAGAKGVKEIRAAVEAMDAATEARGAEARAAKRAGKPAAVDEDADAPVEAKPAKPTPARGQKSLF